MSMRVTQGMINSQLMQNLNRNMVNMSKLKEQMSTGRTINRPSDDPIGVTYSLRYRSELTANDQYQKNVDSALSWLDFSDNMIGQAGDVIHRIKVLTVQGSSGTNPDLALGNISSEIKELRDQLIEIGNSTLSGKYIFNGQKFDQPPYTPTTALTATPDDGNVTYEVGSGATLNINVPGGDIFGNSGDVDQIFAVIDRITTAFDAGDHAAAGAELVNIEGAFDRVISAQADVGAKTNRVELMEDRLANLNLNLTDFQSKTEDADFAELILQAQIQENLFQASLSVGAKIISPSLVDFLR